ncbi:MAG TPA: hypothetical protein VG456_27905 [Candidatus Sulfopaludibacter sp.]|jgi:hypothetical protein|nr:hypothetical protein [Candidatus Sulfopaludibacter sp.]
MYKFLSILVLGGALSAPVVLQAQERTYEDKAHHDSHTWNSDEDAHYRTYLKEHHKKYREFSRANQRDQNDYWKWRHEHEH